MTECDLCHKYGATEDFDGNTYHERCYIKVTEIIANELAKMRNNANDYAER